MRIDRLLQLADFLENEVANQPKYKFDMGHWGDKKFNPVKCHTSACAMGWATVIFKGLSLGYTSDEEKFDKDYEPHIQWRNEKGEVWTGWEACEALFDIPAALTTFFFAGESGAHTAPQIARRIRREVKLILEGKSDFCEIVKNEYGNHKVPDVHSAYSNGEDGVW